MKNIRKFRTLMSDFKNYIVEIFVDDNYYSFNLDYEDTINLLKLLTDLNFEVDYKYKSKQNQN